MSRFTHHQVPILVLILVTLAASITAEVPQIVGYQGRLTDDAGSPVADDTYFIKFKIYGSESGDDSLWYTPFQPVVVTDGLFNYHLGSTVSLPPDLFSGDTSLYLSIAVGAGSESNPRIRLVSAAFSYHSLRSDTAGYAHSAPASSDGDWVIDGNEVYHLGGYVGIGTSTPREDLVVGENIGNWGGNRVVIADSEPGVSTGLIIGKDIDSRSWILWDVDSSYLSIGTKEEGVNFGNAIQIRGGNVGIGIIPHENYCLHIDRTAFVVPGQGLYGVRSNVTSSNNTGIVDGGAFIATNGYEVKGIYASAHGGNGHSAYGVMGVTSGEADYTVGVFGSCGSDNCDYGIYSDGNLHCTGTSTKAGGGFRIDHPQDPENMYLMHADVSSPEQKNVYDGTIVTDSDGDAVVELPSYFESLNESYRYQLTVIGSFAQAIISEKINGNRFSIKTDKPNVEVCWQVTGIRKDAFAKSALIDIEVTKDDEDRGLYQNPGAFGLGIEKSVDYRHHQNLEETQDIE